MNAVVGTNILIDYLSGSSKAKHELESFETIYINLEAQQETTPATS